MRGAATKPKPAQGKSPASSAQQQLLIAACALVGAAVLLAGVWIYASRLPTIVAEKALIVALFSKVPPVQVAAIHLLRDYPTRHAATALVVFINLKNLQELPDPKKETPADRAKRREQRRRDLKLAERATQTLCLLTGQSFGTYFKLEPYGHSWAGLSEEQWPAVLGHVNTWAAESLGGIRLPLLDLILPPLPAAGHARPETTP